MPDSNDHFEGTKILEIMANNNLLDEFWQAIDNDDFSTISQLMRSLDINEELIKSVIQKMKDCDEA